MDRAVSARNGAANVGFAEALIRRRSKPSPPTIAEPLRACRSRRQEASSGEPRLVTSTPTGPPADASLRQRLQADIAAAARELNELRERWLHPPEWTETRYLEFPGTVGGPWDRYLVPGSARASRAATDAPSVAPEKIPTGASESTRGGACAPPTIQVGLVRYLRLEPRDAECAARLKQRTLTNLYNERPAWLDLAHKKLDAAVAAAYGWVRDGQSKTDLSDEQILERLLALNLERAAEEAKAAKVKTPRASRAKCADELL